MQMRDVPVLVPRTYLVTGYDGRPRTVTFTSKDAAESAATINKQLKAGLRIPMCLMHDPDAYPEYVNLSHKDPDYLRQWQVAKGYIGDAKEAFVKDGMTHVRVAIPDPSDAKLFDKIGTVSPSLVRDWVDERGVKWSGLNVLHIGVTPKPVQRDIPRARAYHGTSLSQAMWFSIPLTTGSDAMADEKETDVDVDTDTDTEGGIESHIGELVDALKGVGIYIEGDPKNADEFKVALKSAVATLNGGVEEDTDDDGMADLDAVPTPAFMSQWFPMMSETAVAKVQKEIDQLKADGKLPKPVIDALKAELKDQVEKVELSHRFDKSGNFKPLPVQAKLAAYAELPKGLFAKERVNLSNAIPVPAPKDDKRDGTAEAVAQIEQYFGGNK